MFRVANPFSFHFFSDNEKKIICNGPKTEDVENGSRPRLVTMKKSACLTKTGQFG